MHLKNFPAARAKWVRNPIRITDTEVHWFVFLWPLWDSCSFSDPWSTFMNLSPSESEACHGKSTTDFARGSACHGKRSEDLARVSTCHIWNEFQNSFQPYIQVHLLELLGKTVFGWGRCDWKWRFSNRKTAFAGIHFLHYGWVSAIPWPQVH